jgi:DNA-binding NarL/FixJ family response regulator
LLVGSGLELKEVCSRRRISLQAEVVGMVTNGRTALDSTLALKPDLVILDISMPGMSGIEVAKELRRCESSAKIIFLTVHQDPDILATCLAAGGLGYVVKLLMDTDLIPAMHEALSDRVFVSRFSHPPDVPGLEKKLKQMEEQPPPQK